MAMEVLHTTSPTGVIYGILYMPVESSTYYTLQANNGSEFGADLYGFSKTMQYSHEIG